MVRDDEEALGLGTVDFVPVTDTLLAPCDGESAFGGTANSVEVGMPAAKGPAPPASSRALLLYTVTRAVVAPSGIRHTLNGSAVVLIGIDWRLDRLLARRQY